MTRGTIRWAVLGGVLGAVAAQAGELRVTGVSPLARSLTAPVRAAIRVDFDRPVMRSSVTARSLWAFGKWSGAADGAFSFSNDDRTVTLTPARPFSAGEQVMVVLSHDLRGADGSPLRSGGYSYQFWTRARQARRQFQQVAVLSARTTPNQGTRAYGGIGSDLNRDGWLDITLVNEDTADLRVFMNRADGTGLLNPFLQPTFPVGQQASPSEPSDFNRDGIVDICVANVSANTVSVLLGLGDGRYGPQQSIPVGARPRGIAVLDVDGDGDTDIVNTNSSSSNLSLMLNDGAGVFSGPTFFDGGGSGEWALAAADMNNDAILDLVVGAQSSQQIIVLRGNGNGTFSQTGAASAGGRTWMLVCGDVNGDGHEDVATVNSSTNNAAILLGNGAGGLSAPQTYATDPFPLATDLGDLDGDADLDWKTSSFGGDFFLFRNNGDGTFTLDQEINAVQAASCALLLDIDNDRDLDLGLIDELADTITLMRNGGISPPGDINGDCLVDQSDLGILLAAWGSGPSGDLDGDGDTDQADLGILLADWGRSCP